MSRSYKRFATFIISDNKGPHRYKAKTLANRAVRRSSICGGKSAYKRLYDSWDIRDVRIPMEDITQLRVAWKRGEDWLHIRFDTLREAERYFKVKYYRK